MAIGTRVPHRQSTDATNQEIENYQDNAGGGVNRHPYNTDEAELFAADHKRIDAENAKKKANLRK